MHMNSVPQVLEKYYSASPRRSKGSKYTKNCQNGSFCPINRGDRGKLDTFLHMVHYFNLGSNVTLQSSLKSQFSVLYIIIKLIPLKNLCGFFSANLTKIFLKASNLPRRRGKLDTPLGQVCFDLPQKISSIGFQKTCYKVVNN